MFDFFDHIAYLYLFVSNIQRAHNTPVFFQHRPRNAMNLQIQAQRLRPDRWAAPACQRRASPRPEPWPGGRHARRRAPFRCQWPARRRGQVLQHRSAPQGRSCPAVEDTQSDLYVAIDRAAGTHRPHARPPPGPETSRLPWVQAASRHRPARKRHDRTVRAVPERTASRYLAGISRGSHDCRRAADPVAALSGLGPWQKGRDT
jgi:hypothetical protein